MVWCTDHEFLYNKDFTVSLVWGELFGGGFSPPPWFGLWPYPVLERKFEQTLCSDSNNASDIIEHLLYTGTFPMDFLQFLDGNMHVQG